MAARRSTALSHCFSSAVMLPPPAQMPSADRRLPAEAWRHTVPADRQGGLLQRCRRNAAALQQHPVQKVRPFSQPVGPHDAAQVHAVDAGAEIVRQGRAVHRIRQPGQLPEAGAVQHKIALLTVAGLRQSLTGPAVRPVPSRQGGSPAAPAAGSPTAAAPGPIGLLPSAGGGSPRPGSLPIPSDCDSPWAAGKRPGSVHRAYPCPDGRTAPPAAGPTA